MYICGGSDNQLNSGLSMLDLRLLDADGGGDCFFKSVSYQLYSNPDHHLDIRAAGIQYLREHPERFIIIL